jgi:hypothetical protein
MAAVLCGGVVIAGLTFAPLFVCMYVVGAMDGSQQGTGFTTRSGGSEKDGSYIAAVKSIRVRNTIAYLLAVYHCFALPYPHCQGHTISLVTITIEL